MSGLLLACSVFRALDSAGVPMTGATLQFYETETLIPQSVFTTTALSVALPNPVVADSAGLFPPIYYDPSLTYRMVMKSAAGVTVQDIDPVASPFNNPNGSISASMLEEGAAAANLGYTAANKGGDTITDLRLAFGATLYSDNAGYLGLPVIDHSANATFALTDSGHLCLNSSGTAVAWTIPLFSTVPFPTGTIIPCRNFSSGGAGAVTLTRASGVHLRIAGAATDQNVTLAAWAMGALINEAADNWIWTGTGGS